MKKILLIAPSCFPVTGAECIVNIKMLKALNLKEDFVIDLVSKKIKNDNYPSNTIEELGIKLNTCHIVEVDNKISLSTIFQHILCYFKFGVVYKGCHWAIKALPVVENLVKQNKYDYVLTKNAPAPMLGYYLKKKYGIKWLFTCNDPYPVFTYPKIYADFRKAKKDYFGCKRLKLIKKYADILVFPSYRLQQHMKSYIGFEDDKSVVIPHAVNESNIQISQKRNDVLKIIHSGNLRYPRDPKVFFEGLRLFVDSVKSPKISVTIQGVADNTLNEMINSYRLESYINYKGSVTYKESLEDLKNYDIALIIEAKCPVGIFLPTKVTDFMQCNIPILAVSPEVGVLNDLYNNGNIGYFASNVNPYEVYKVLNVLYNDFLNGKIKQNVIPAEYKEKNIAQKYYSF